MTSSILGKGGDGSFPAALKPQGVAAAIDRATGILVAVAMVVASLCVVAIIAIGTFDTIGRTFNRPLLGAVEMTESLLAVTIFLALPYAQRHYQHVVVDIAIQKLSNRWRLVVHFFALIFTLGAFCLLFMQSYQGAVHSWSVGEVSAGYVRVPVWLAKALSALGLAIAALETLRQIIWALLWPHLAFRARDSLRAEDASLE